MIILSALAIILVIVLILASWGLFIFLGYEIAKWGGINPWIGAACGLAHFVGVFWLSVVMLIKKSIDNGKAAP